MLLGLVILDLVLAWSPQEFDYGPLEVSWPNTWISSRFEVDSNYVNDATLICFYFRIDGLNEDLSKYYSALKIPYNTSYSSCTLSRFSSLQNEWKAACPYSFSSNLLLYGPIEFILAESFSGQILAQSHNAGFLSLLEGYAPSNTNKLTVSLIEYTLNSYNQETDLMNFYFTLPDNTQIFPDDYLILIPKRSFVIDSLEVWMNDGETKIDLHYNYLDISIYIFGFEQILSQEISIYVKILTLQSSNLRAGLFPWNLEIKKYGVNTLIARYYGEGPGFNPNGLIIEIEKWAPLNSEAFELESILPNNIEIYTELTFITKIYLPADGAIIINYSGVTINDYDLSTGEKQKKVSFTENPTIFWNSDANIIAEIISSYEVKITSTEGILEGSSISLTNYLVINTPNSSIKVTVSILPNPNSNLIPGNSITLAITNSNDRLITNVEVWMTENQNSTKEVNELGQRKNYGIAVTFIPKQALTAGDIIDIYFPIATGFLPLQNYIVFSSELWGVSFDDINKAGFTSTLVFDPDSHDGFIYQETGRISFTVTAGTTQDKPVILYIGAGTKSSPRRVLTPLFSNRMPSEVIIKIVKNSIEYYGTSMLSFKPLKIKPVLEFLCQNQHVEGIPIRISYDTYEWPLPADVLITTTYNFSTSSNFLNLYKDSGLDHGDQYPSSESNLKINSDGTVYNELTTGLITTRISFYLPVFGIGDSSKISVGIFINAQLLTSNKISLIYSGYADSVNRIAANTTGVGSPVARSVSTVINTQTQLNVTVKSAAKADIDNDGKYTSTLNYSAILILPGGGFPNSTSFQSISLTSSNINFPFNIYIKEGLGVVNELLEETLLINIMSPWYESQDFKYYFLFGYSPVLSNTNCTTLQGNIKTTAETVSILKYSPISVSNYIYNQRTTSVSLDFTPLSKIHIGSILKIKLFHWNETTSKDWVVVGGSWTFDGTASSDIWISDETKFEIPLGKTFNVQISNVVRPVLGTVSSFQGFSSIEILKNSNTYVRWKNSGSETTTNLTIANENKQVYSNAKMWVYPDVIGTINAYFYLSFISTYLIPSGATVVVYGDFKDKINSQQDVWCSTSSTSSYILDGVLTIFIAKDIKESGKFEMILKNSLDILKPVSKPVLVTVVCDDLFYTTVIKDTKKAVPNQYYEIHDAPDYFIQSFDIIQESKSSGLPTWYTFNLTVSEEYKSGFIINLESCGDFNAIPGPFTYSDDKKLPQLQSETIQSSITSCFAKNWIITCNNDGMVQANYSITFKILLYNGLLKGSFNLYITDKDDNFLYKPYYSSNLQMVNEISEILTINYIETKIDELYLNVSFYVSFDAVDLDNTTLFFTFPEPFDFKLFDTEIMRYSVQTKDESNVSQFLDCTAENNKATVSNNDTNRIPLSDWYIFTIHYIEIPSKGYSKERWIYEYKTYEFVSYNFKFYLSDSENLIVGASYENLNTAFAKFDKVDPNDYSSIQILVNKENVIDAYSGFKNGPFTIESENGDIKAFSIKIIARTIFDKEGSSDIKLSNDGIYHLDYINPKAEMYISVPSNVSNGVYKISWEIKDANYLDCDHSKYIKPKDTLIRVIQEKINLLVDTTDILVLDEGYPVKLFIDVKDRNIFQMNKLEIYFTSYQSDADFDILPNPVLIEENTKYSYFSIMCHNCIQYEEYIFIVELNGKNSEIYTAYNYSFNFYEDFEDINSTYALTFDQLTHFSVDLNYESSNIAKVTWILISSESEKLYNYSYEEILTNIDMTYYNLSIDYCEYIKNDYDLTIDNSEDYPDMMITLLNYGNNILIESQSIVKADQINPNSIKCLFPNTNYSVIYFMDNLKDDDPKENFDSITTEEIPGHALLTIRSKKKKNCSIVDIIAINLGWNSKFIEIVYESSSSLSSLASVYVYADPFSEISPEILLQNKRKSLENALEANISVDLVYPYDFGISAFENATWNEESDEILEFSFTPSVNGKLYCIVKYNPDVEPSSTRVLLDSYFRQGEIFDNQEDVKANSNSIYKWNISDLFSDYGFYSFSCIICNEFPGVPLCSVVESKQIEYARPTKKVSFARRLYAAALLFLVLV